MTNTTLITGNGVIGAAVINSGTLTATGGTLTLALAPVQNGSVNIASSGTLNVQQDWQNNGTVTLAGGGLRGSVVTNTTLITGSGVIGAAVVSTGSLRATNGTLTVSGVIAGTGATFADDSGTLTLNGANTYTGLTAINGGQLVVGNANAVQNSTVSNTTANNGIAFTVNSANFSGLVGTGNFGLTNGAVGVALSVGANNNDSTYSGVISGAGGLTKTGTGNLTLSNSNAYSGGTVVQNGTLRLGVYGAVLDGTALTVNGGIFDQNGNAVSVSSLNGTGGTISNAGLTVSGSGNFAGAIVGVGSFAKSGSGAQTLSGVSSYTGNTLVSGGTLTVSGTLASTNLTVTGGQFNWANVGVLTNVVGVSVSGGTVNFSTSGTIDALTGSGQVNVNTNALQVGFNNASTTFAGAISGAGTLDKVGSGALTLTGTGSTLGNVIVGNGALVLNGGSLTATNFSVNTVSQLALNSGTLTVKNAVISNNTDFVVGNGSGAATLNLITGGTATFQNNLIVTNNGTLKGAANIVVAGGTGSVIVQDGGTLGLGSTPGTMTISGNTVWQGGGQFVWDINNFAGTQGSSSGWDWLNVLGTLSTSASATNPFTIDIATLNGSSPGQAANFNSAIDYALTIATGQSLTNLNLADIVLNTAQFKNASDGDFQLSLQGGTNLVLSYNSANISTWTDVTGNFSSSNSWIGSKRPADGTTNVALYFGGSTAIPYTATLDFTNLLTKRIVLTNSNTSVVQTVDGNPFTFIGLAPEINQNGNGGFVISNNVTLGSTLSVGGSGGGTVTLSGNINSTGGSGSLTKSGTFTLILGGSNTYNGATVVNNGSLFIANSYGLSGSTLSNTVPGAVVFTNNISTAYLGGLAGSVDLGLTNTSGGQVNLVVGGNNRSSTYSGALSGTGSLTKQGSGTLTLSGVNTYSGDTIVNAGTLIAGSLNNGIGGAGSSLGTSKNVFITGGTLRFGIGALLSVTNPTDGSINFNGGTLNAANLVNYGHIANFGNTSTIDANFSNAAYLDATNGTLVVNGTMFNASTGMITNSATLKIGATGSGWMTNAGSVVMAGGIVKAGTLNNDGTISGYGTLGSAGSTLANTLLVSATNGVLSIAGAATGTGAYRAEAGATLSFNAGGQISSLFNTGGTIRIAGGMLTNTSNAFSNNGGTLALVGGGYRSAVQFTNTGWLVGYGSFNSAAPLVNQGTIAVNSGTLTPLVFNSNLLNTTSGVVRADYGALQVSGVFTNNGTLQFISSVGTYNQTVVNDGAWLTQNSSSIFSNNFVITTNGYVSASAGSQYVFKADLLNQSTNNLAWNTLGTTPGNGPGGGTKFLFSGSDVTSTQTFYTPGLLLTGGFDGVPSNPTTGVQNVSLISEIAGFSNNFAIGQLWLTNTMLVLEQTPGMLNHNGALFVNDLYLFGDSQLVISNDMTVYFVNSNGWTLADITLLGNAQIHQLNSLVIPEPNVLLMWLCGMITVWAARRRTRRNNQQA